jgi:hypothetical protein
MILDHIIISSNSEIRIATCMIISNRVGGLLSIIKRIILIRLLDIKKPINPFIQLNKYMHMNENRTINIDTALAIALASIALFSMVFCFSMIIYMNDPKADIAMVICAIRLSALFTTAVSLFGIIYFLPNVQAHSLPPPK